MLCLLTDLFRFYWKWCCWYTLFIILVNMYVEQYWPFRHCSDRKFKSMEEACENVYKRILYSVKKLWVQALIMPFQPCVAFHIEPSHLFCTAKQVTCFYMKRNTGLKWVMQLLVAQSKWIRLIITPLWNFS